VFEANDSSKGKSSSLPHCLQCRSVAEWVDLADGDGFCATDCARSYGVRQMLKYAVEAEADGDNMNLEVFRVDVGLATMWAQVVAALPT
jgi:hypothetical protein